MTTFLATGALSVRAPRSALARTSPRGPRGGAALLAAFALTNAALADGMSLRSVTLYRSGVASFERTGTIDADAIATLDLDVDYLNDVLRSIVVLDAGATTPPSISYSSGEPLSRLLDRFQVDVRRVATEMDLLAQLRGVRMRFSTPDGPVEGLVIGVETRSLPNADDGAGRFVTLMTDRGVKSINLARVSSFEILDDRVASDLRDALRTLAERRAEDRAELRVRFGEGKERSATIVYMHEAPVWKTSYRLVLPEDTAGEPLLQGWAIVENQTDEDWRGVRLSLASGRPVAFTMDLRTPLFVARPQIAPPIPGALASRAYTDTVSVQRAAALAAPSAPRMQRDQSAYANQVLSLASKADAGASADAEEDRVAMGGTIAGQTAASAAASGEQFRYEIARPVDIGAKSNAMLPVVAGPVEGRRVSIYNADDLAEHPMRGVEFTNTSGADLAAGPVTVYDGDSYVGDAQVGFTSRGQDRLLSYAVDQDVRALREQSRTSRVARISIVDGVLERTVVSASTTTYTFVNRDNSRGREIIVEQPKFDAGWTLKTPQKAESESERLQRFRVELKAGETKTLPVTHEMTERTTIALTDADLPQLLAYSANGVASKRVVDAVREAQRLRNEVATLDAAMARLANERDQIARDQGRIRSNMNSIDRNSDLYTRYMRTLAEQEDRLTALDAEQAQRVDERQAADKAFRDYLRNLTVE